MTPPVDRNKDGTDDFEELKYDVAKDGWENRRAIAWISFIGAIVYPFLVAGCWLADPELAKTMVDLATAIYTLAGANLTWYFTMSTWEKVKK